MGRHLSEEEEERVLAVSDAIDVPSRWLMRLVMTGREWVTQCGYTEEEIHRFVQRSGRSEPVRRHAGVWKDRSSIQRVVEEERKRMREKKCSG